jgi:hypothetical protein
MIPASRLCPVVGLPLAIRICMILVFIRMKVLAENHWRSSEMGTILGTILEFK